MGGSISLAAMWCALLGWDPLGWVHQLDWYQKMLRADWFQSIRPYWIDYRLDWVVAGVLLFSVLLIVGWLVRRGRRPRTGKVDQRRAAALAIKTAEHYLASGEPMLAVQAFQAAGEEERALQILVEHGAWAQAASAAEGLGLLLPAAEYYEQAKDSAGSVRVLAAAGQLDRAAEIYRREDRIVDAAELYLKHGQTLKAAWLLREVGLFSKAATLFTEASELLLAADVLLQFVAEARSGFTQDEAEQLLQGAASLCKAGRVRESAELLRAAGEYEGAALRFEELGERTQAAECYERIGKLRRAVEVTDDPQKRLVLIERLRREGQRVTDLELAQALTAAGRHDQAAEQFKSMGDTDAAVGACLNAGNLADAAQLLADRGRHAEAASVFVESGDLMAARDQYLLAKDPAAAAEMAYRSGQYFDAGVDFFRLGDLGRAIEALQQVEGKHPQSRTASSLLGQAFAQLGDLEMGHRMHRRATADARLDRSNLSLFYHMARFLESTGKEQDLFSAKVIYADILEVDYSFEDVKTRHDQIG